MPKASPTIIRIALILIMAAGIGGVYHLASSGQGGGVDLFTEDLASEGIDPEVFIPEAAAMAAEQPVDPAVADEPTATPAAGLDGAQTNGANEEIPDALPLIEGGVDDDPAAVVDEIAEADTDAVVLPADGIGQVVTTSPAGTTTRTAVATGDPRFDFSPVPAQTTTNTATTNTTTINTATPIQATTQQGGVPQVTTTQSPTTPTTTQQAATPQAAPATDAEDATPAAETPEETTPAATVTPPAGPWCQVEVRQTDGVIRWDDDGRTTVIRRNDAWFHTPDEAAQAILIPEVVNTNDQYVLRLWGGGTTDIICPFVSTANAQPDPTPTANTTPPEPEVATVAALPTPIAVPSGPVQMGFAADLWADDRSNYWNELDAVPGSGRLIAHEFKSFTKDIKTDVYRWHLESGRDLLLTWNGTDAETILNGSHDEWIREHARELGSLPGDVMLRFWHEPDVSHKRAWIDNDPQQFIDSWIYVRQIFAEENALNIEWVWCPTAWNWNEQGARYYPGDANVDWICSDGYTGWDLDAPLTDIADAYTDFQAWADQRPHKPILIAEFGAGERGPGDRAEWVRSIPEWVSDSPSIKAVVYFDVDRRPHGEIYDWRLRTEPDAWAEMMDVLSSAPFGR